GAEPTPWFYHAPHAAPPDRLRVRPHRDGGGGVHGWCLGRRRGRWDAGSGTERHAGPPPADRRFGPSRVRLRNLPGAAGSAEGNPRGRERLGGMVRAVPGGGPGPGVRLALLRPPRPVLGGAHLGLAIIGE